MSSITREVAKFLSGYAAAETLGHWWMGIWGRDLLPMDIGWFTFTPAFNTFAMICWPLVLATLMYVGWFRKAERASVGAQAAAGGPVTA
jgi:hypothetical protein